MVALRRRGCLLYRRCSEERATQRWKMKGEFGGEVAAQYSVVVVWCPDVRLMWMQAIVVEMTVKMPATSIAHCSEKVWGGVGHVACV